jgi:hypothetical protein
LYENITSSVEKTSREAEAKPFHCSLSRAGKLNDKTSLHSWSHRTRTNHPIIKYQISNHYKIVVIKTSSSLIESFCHIVACFRNYQIVFFYKLISKPLLEKQDEHRYVEESFAQHSRQDN